MAEESVARLDFETKRCCTCGEVRPTTEFNKDRSTQDGIAERCKLCRRECRLKYRENSSGYMKQYRRENAASIAEQKKRHEREIRDYIRERERRYRANNPDKIKEISHRAYYKDVERTRALRNEFDRLRKQKDPKAFSDYKKDVRERNLITALLGGARKRARQIGVPFNLERGDFVVPEFCPILGIPLIVGRGGGPTPNSPSLDRVVPELGYVKGNVVVISFYANRIKHDCADPEVCRKIADYIEAARDAQHCLYFSGCSGAPS